MEIVYHKPNEWEQLQARIGRWSLKDVASTINRNKTREAYGSTEGSIVLIIPKKDRQGVN